MASMEHVRDFLAQERFAIAGVSRKPRHFSRVLFREFIHRGYNAIPVNANAQEIEGRPCYARVQDIQPPVEGVLLMTPASAAPEMGRDCHAAGVKRVWMYRAIGQGSVDAEAVRYCEEHGMAVIAGECPFLFLPDAAWLHRLHGFCKRVAGTYPR